MARRGKGRRPAQTLLPQASPVNDSGCLHAASVAITGFIEKRVQAAQQFPEHVVRSFTKKAADRALPCTGAASDGIHSEHALDVMANDGRGSIFEGVITDRLVLSRQVLAKQGERQRTAQVAHEAAHFLLYRLQRPIITAAIAETERAGKFLLLPIAAVVWLPVTRTAKHLGFQRFTHVRRPVSVLRHFTLDCGVRKDSFTECKGQPGTDFENGEMVLHHLLKTRRSLVVGGVRLVYQFRNVRESRGQLPGLLPVVLKNRSVAELYTRLHDNCDYVFPGGLETVRQKGLLERFQGELRIFQSRGRRAFAFGRFPARYRNLRANRAALVSPA